MTRAELKKLEDKAREIKRKIIDEFNTRVSELSVIAKEKGITSFGWTDGEVEEPYYMDFDTEEEREAAEDRYEEFREMRIGFIWMNDHNFIPYDGYSFEIDERGGIIFTAVVNVEDECEGEYEDDVCREFYPHIANNWEVCSEIIGVIEYQLGL